jgi:hypothetical protein
MLAVLKSSPRPKLASAGGFDSPARAALAIAIAEKAAADEAHRKLVAAGESLAQAVYTADGVVEAARQAIEDAKEGTVRHLTAIATGEAGKAPKTVKQARQEMTDAEEALELARAARDGLTGRIDEARATAARMVDRVREAAKGVLAEAPAATGLLAEVIDLQREIINKGRAMSWLMGQGILPGASSAMRQSGDPLRDAYITRLFVDMLPVDYAVAADASCAPAWQAALEALCVDPSAELPSG